MKKRACLWIIASFFIWEFYCKVESKNNEDACNLPDDIARQIDSHETVIRKIIDTASNGSYKGRTWQELDNFIVKFGPRLTGSRNLENSIDYMLQKLTEANLENVHGEPVTVPHWVRGKESVTLLKPRKMNLAVLGLGYSVGTPPEGITAEAMVVKSFSELKKRAAEVPGRIVVYNQKYITYGKSVVYRGRGATEASKLGAVAVLIKSVTPVSLYTPHTGMMQYGPNVTKIPAACITVEDAQLLHEMALRGSLIKLNIKMEAKMLPEVQSRNVIAEITGRSNPEKVVVVSGHIDSWDVGQGAMDDGGGAFISWNALALLKSLGLRPQKTIRSILWTGEEFGIIGANQYIQEHKVDEPNLQLVMESDIGTFAPLGLAVTGNQLVTCVLKRIIRLLTPIGELGVREPQEGPDIGQWVQNGVPGASLWNKNDRYFWYHHTNADTMLVEDPESLDKGTALFACVSYVVANLSINLPHVVPNNNRNS